MTGGMLMVETFVVIKFLRPEQSMLQLYQTMATQHD